MDGILKEVGFKHIFYSILCHEKIDCIFDMIKNIKKYNKDYKVSIILNINHYLSKLIKEKNINLPENVIINTDISEKIHSTHTILKGHLSNFNFIKDLDFDYFCLLASNCMFIRNINYNYIDTFYKKKYDVIKKADGFKLQTGWHWDSIYRNEKIINIFKERDMALYDSQHEGRVYVKYMFNELNNEITKLKIFDLIQVDTLFEEFLLSTFERYLFGTEVPIVCKIFWSNHNYIASIEDIEKIRKDDSIISVVKRVSREIDDPIRKYIMIGYN